MSTFIYNTYMLMNVARKTNVLHFYSNVYACTFPTFPPIKRVIVLFHFYYVYSIDSIS